MSYEDRAEKHERLLQRFFRLQRRYAALEGRDRKTRDRRSRVSRSIALLHLELERLRRADLSDAPVAQPEISSPPRHRMPGADRVHGAIVRCALCGFVALYASWPAAGEGGWRVLNAGQGKGVCPACIADDAASRDPSSSADQ